MRYKDWIKVGQMTNKEVLNDIELLVGVLKGDYKDDTLFEDYTEVRRIVQGEGDLWVMTHGEFLEVLKDLVKREFDSAAENFRLQLQISRIESICFDTWEGEQDNENL
jgi:hypothetical protein